MGQPVPTPEQKKNAKAYESIYRTYGRLYARFTEGLVRRESKVEVFACNHISVFNGLFPPHWSDKEAAPNLRKALAMYKKSGQAMFVLLGPSANDSALRPLLLDYGFKCTYWVPFMHLDLDQPVKRFAAPSGIRIKQIEDLGIFTKEHPHPWIGPITTEIRKSSLAFAQSLCRGKNRRAWHFIAFSGERAVGSAVVFRHRNATAIFDVAVDKKFRRRGIGKALMSKACAFARKQGLTEAGLSASGPGVGLYSKVGFTDAGRYGSYFLSKGKIASLKL